MRLTLSVLAIITLSCGTDLPNAPLSFQYSSDTPTTFTWDTVSGADSYNLYYSTNGCSSFTRVQGVSTPYDFTGITSNTCGYCIYVTAVNSSGESRNSDFVNVTCSEDGTPTLF